LVSISLAWRFASCMPRSCFICWEKAEKENIYSKGKPMLVTYHRLVTGHSRENFPNRLLHEDSAYEPKCFPFRLHWTYGINNKSVHQHDKEIIKLNSVINKKTRYWCSSKSASSSSIFWEIFLISFRSALYLPNSCSAKIAHNVQLHILELNTYDFLRWYFYFFRHIDVSLVTALKFSSSLQVRYYVW
jgi:hypothetical protein